MTRLLLSAAALALSGCATLRPGGHVPVTGSYRYQAEYRLPDGRTGGTFSGTLVIREAAPERITGGWAVPGYQRELQIGAYHEGSYVANADVLEGNRAVGTFQHRVRRAGGPTELVCEGEFVTRAAANVVTYPGSCSLTFQGS